MAEQIFKMADLLPLGAEPLYKITASFGVAELPLKIAASFEMVEQLLKINASFKMTELPFAASFWGAEPMIATSFRRWSNCLLTPY